MIPYIPLLNEFTVSKPLNAQIANTHSLFLHLCLFLLPLTMAGIKVHLLPLITIRILLMLLSLPLLMLISLILILLLLLLHFQVLRLPIR